MICKTQCTRYDLEFIEFDVITIIVLMRDIETRSSDIKTEYYSGFESCRLEHSVSLCSPQRQDILYVPLQDISSFNSTKK